MELISYRKLRQRMLEKSQKVSIEIHKLAKISRLEMFFE